MSLIKWSPFFQPFEDFDAAMQQLAPMQRNSIIPAIDVYDANGSVIVETALPGVDPTKVDIAVENGVLTMSGSSERKTEVDEKNYYRKEIRSGSFQRQVMLPADVDEKSAKATFHDGILKIEFTKSEKAKPKKIHIDVK